jgi:hypothetical protein
MELNKNAQIDTGQVRDVGSSRGGGLGGRPIPGGVGGGVVVGLIDTSDALAAAAFTTDVSVGEPNSCNMFAS